MNLRILHLDVESIAQTVTKQGEGENGGENRQTRHDHHPRSGLKVRLSGLNHGAPRRGGRNNAHAQEGQGGLGKDGAADVHGRVDDDGSYGVGEDMTRDDGAAQMRP